MMKTISTLCIALALVTGSAVVQASQAGHEPLQKSAALDFQQILAEAEITVPERLIAASSQQQADAFGRVGGSWLAGRPSVALNYYDDRANANLGLKEMEAGVHLPLWRWGEKDAAQKLGAAYGQQSATWQQWFRLMVAGQVRAVLADIEQAEVTLALEREATADAQTLLNLTEKRHAAGEAAKLDVMQSQSLLLDQRRKELEAEALLVDAERSYQMLTGLNVRPDQGHRETLSTQEDIEATHPYLLWLESQSAIAAGTVDREQLAARGSPVVGIGTRRERGAGNEDYVDSIGLSITVPFGGSSHVSAATSAAQKAWVDSQVRYQSAWRELEQQLHEAEHSLFLTGEALAMAEIQLEIGEQRWAMAKKAFDVGESTLPQVIQAMQAARESRRNQHLLVLQQQRLISEYNQIIGVLP